MTKRKDNLQKLNNARNRAINRYIDSLHNKVAELYEALIDNEIDDAIKTQRELASELRTLKIEEERL